MHNFLLFLFIHNLMDMERLLIILLHTFGDASIDNCVNYKDMCVWNFDPFQTLSKLQVYVKQYLFHKRYSLVDSPTVLISKGS